MSKTLAALLCGAGLTLAGKLDPEVRQHHDRGGEPEQSEVDQPRMAGLADGDDERAPEQDQDTGDESRTDDERRQQHDPALNIAGSKESHYSEIVPDPLPAPDANYSSGSDYVVEFLGYHFSFGAADFEGRVVSAAVKLGVVETSELDEEEIEDLVTLAAQGLIDAPASRLGRYLVRNWERVSLVEGESLVYWLRKLIFRGAWLDHQVKRGALDVVWDEDDAEFAYQHPGGGGRPLLELAPVPSWHELQFKP